ncbi:MAG: ParA family protein [Alphaproteobacteria bacterium]|nr:ParA family protein [Alphaproteobacteria bacterium]
MRLATTRWNRAERSLPPTKSLPKGDKQATIVAVAAQKGGVGKTTTTVSLASAWARYHGKRVLVVDLDPQNHVTLALREQIGIGGGPLSELLTDPANTLEVEEIRTGTEVPELYVTPPDPDLLNAEDGMAHRIGKELVLRKALEITRTHYDIILLDCPPNMGTLTVNGLVAADTVLVPAQASMLAVSGIDGLFRTLDEVGGQLNPSLDLLGVVLTRVDGRTRKSNEAVRDLVKSSWGDVVLPVHIGANDTLAQAQLAGRDIFGFAPSSRGAQQYRELAADLLDRFPK